MINSSLVGKYIKTFINGTISFQINDARQVPIIIPTLQQLQEFEALFDGAYALQVEKFTQNKDNTNELQAIQNELDTMVYKLYGLENLAN